MFTVERPLSSYTLWGRIRPRAEIAATSKYLQELDGNRYMDMVPDPKLSADQKATVEQLSDREVEIIDSLLVDLCSDRFQKVARIVGEFTKQRKFKTQLLPDIFLANRVYELVNSGALDHQGFLNHMRFCEVRLAAANDKIKFL